MKLRKINEDNFVDENDCYSGLIKLEGKYYCYKHNRTFVGKCYWSNTINKYYL